MTRVLMTADTVGGVWTYALELADALAPFGVEMVLATMGPPMSSSQAAAVASSAVVEVVEGDFRLEWQDDPWASVDAAGDWLLGLEARHAPDLVHLNGYVHASLPWQSPVVVVAHSDVRSWWRAVHATPAPPEWDTYRARVTTGLRAADAVVAPTAAVAADLEREYAVPGVRVVANARRSDWVHPVPKQPVVLATGRMWDAAKNLQLLEAAAPQLRWPVHVAGAEHADAVRALGVLPWPALRRHLLAAAVFAAPARYEPFGLGPLEAGLAGCALVLGDVPSLREVWGDAADYVDPDDAHALVAAVNRLADDERRRQERAAAAQARAAAYSPQRQGCAYADLYASLSATDQRRPACAS